MKLLKSKLWAFALFLATTLSVVGCQKDPVPIDPPTPMPDPENAVIMPGAWAIFGGPEPDSGNGYFLMTLYSEGLTINKDSWKFTGSGEFIWLELFSDLPEDFKKLSVGEGEYLVVPFNSSFGERDIYAGEADESGAVGGSFYATVIDDKETLDLITEGNMYVSREGGKYKIIIMMLTQSGKELVWKYENTLEIGIFGVPIPPDPFAGTFTSAFYMYFDDFYDVEFGNGMIELSDIPTDIEFGSGHILGLDFSTPLIASQNDMTVPAGTYNIDASQTFDKPMTFNAGSWEDKILHGSFWVDVNTQGGDEALYAVSDGSFVVSQLSGGKFKIVANVTLEDGSTREGTFEGQLRMNDESCLSRLVDGGVNLTNFTQGLMAYRGIDVQYFGNNSANWAVVLGTEGLDLMSMEGEGDAIFLDINTPVENVTDLPAGSFKKIEKFNATALVPMTYVPGYYDKLRTSLSGTWYMKDMNHTAPGAEGTIAIEKLGGRNYSIEFDMKDDYHYVTGGNELKGNYSGELSYIDATIVPPRQIPAFLSKASAPVAIESVTAKGKRTLHKTNNHFRRAAYGR